MLTDPNVTKNSELLCTQKQLYIVLKDFSGDVAAWRYVTPTDFIRALHDSLWIREYGLLT